MQLLVVGMPLPNPRIDNYSFFSAPSFFDYDAVLIEPASISELIEEVVAGTGSGQTTAAQEPLVNAPTAGLNVGLADLIRRRRDETERLLERGGTVAVFARPNVTHPQVAGFAGADRYSWLPAPAGLAYAEPYLVPAFGTQVTVTDSSHPLAVFADTYANWFHYRAYFSERHPTLGPLTHVFARSIGGAAVGFELRYGRGKIIFLPAMFQIPAGDPRFKLATMLLDGLTQTVHAAVEATPPDWAGRATLPGTDQLEAAEQQAARQLDEAIERHREASAALDQVQRFRRLLWQEGRYGLEPVVREAFQMLGFYVNLDLDRPAVLEADGRTAFLEVEGSQETVVEWPYFRLQKRLERDLLDTQKPKKGIIVVNGQRLAPPDDRGRPFTETLRVAAENYGYALLRSDQLFMLVRAALSDADDDSRRYLRNLIWEMSGSQTPEGFPQDRALPMPETE